jgi:hypothetical protein
MLEFVLSGVTSFSSIAGLCARRSAGIADDDGVGATLNRIEAVIPMHIDLRFEDGEFRERGAVLTALVGARKLGLPAPPSLHSIDRNGDKHGPWVELSTK